MTYPFYFKVKLYIDPDTYYQSGFGIAHNFTEATKQLEDTYGTDLLAICHLELQESDSFIIMPDEMCRKILENDDFSKLEKE